MKVMPNKVDSPLANVTCRLHIVYPHVISRDARYTEQAVCLPVTSSAMYADAIYGDDLAGPAELQDAADVAGLPRVQRKRACRAFVFNLATGVYLKRERNLLDRLQRFRSSINFLSAAMENVSHSRGTTLGWTSCFLGLTADGGRAAFQTRENGFASVRYFTWTARGGRTVAPATVAQRWLASRLPSLSSQYLEHGWCA